jgi:NADPH-dependent 2,4-dienoyl-CoA reductase/sulfur reductase-like enzyme
LSRIVIVGGSDAGISAALRIRELDDKSDVEVVLDDAYPNFSICGIPYYVSGDVSGASLLIATSRPSKRPECDSTWTRPHIASTRTAASCSSQTRRVRKR